jgi:hypothetical protein
MDFFKPKDSPTSENQTYTKEEQEMLERILKQASAKQSTQNADKTSNSIPSNGDIPKVQYIQKEEKEPLPLWKLIWKLIIGLTISPIKSLAKELEQYCKASWVRYIISILAYALLVLLIIK